MFDLSLILKCISTIIGVIIFSLFIINRFIQLYNQKFSNDIYMKIKMIYLLWYTGAITFVCLLFRSYFTPIIIITSILIQIFFSFLLPLILYRDIKGYKNKIRKSCEKLIKDNDNNSNSNSNSNSSNKDLLIILKDKFGINAMWVFIFLLFVLLILPYVSKLGEYNASRRTQYMIIQKPTTKVVISKYNGCFVVAPVDLKKKLIIPEIELIKIENIGKLVISNTGPLKVK